MSPADRKAILEARLKLAYELLGSIVKFCTEMHESGRSGLDIADELRRCQRNMVIRNGKVEYLDEHPEARA